MTTIRLHGILAKKFGNEFKLHLGNLNQLILAIDAIKTGFRKEINKLNQNGGNYCIQRDKKTSIVHIIPFLCGFKSGFLTALLIVAIVIILVVITIVAPPLGGLGWSALFGVTAAGTATVATVTVGFLFQLGLGLLIGVLTFKPPEASLGSSSVVGGGSTATEAAGKSYVFSNYNNAETQGSAVPIGYGAMKVGSKLLNASMKSYLTNSKFEDESVQIQSNSIFSNYLAF